MMVEVVKDVMGDSGSSEVVMGDSGSSEGCDG